MFLDRVSRLFPTPFLLTVLTISLATNVVLIMRLRYPDQWRRAQLALLPAPQVLTTDHLRGNPGASVTVIEYADFQCPFCAEFHQSMRTLLGETDTRWVYRHLPVDRIHPLARRAAEASECAAEQGRFWEYGDALFERQPEIADSLFDVIAQRVGLDQATFGACLESERVRAVVAAHLQDGVKRKVTGTPTFYINGKRFDGLPGHEELERLLREAEG